MDFEFLDSWIRSKASEACSLHKYAEAGCATVSTAFNAIEEFTAFTEFESKIFRCMLIVLFVNTLLICLAWRVYGEKISKRFIYPATYKEHDLISRGAKSLLLPNEHTPRT